MNNNPAIYIGLGGTGIHCLAEVKKNFEEFYGGNIPSHIAFMALDFDRAIIESPELPTSICDNIVVLNDISEHQYNHSIRQHEWVFPLNVIEFSPHNTAAHRLIGRLFTEIHLRTIEHHLYSCWSQVTNLANTTTHGKPFNYKSVEVYILTSLVGGTGAGSFINIAELIRHNFGNSAIIIGYGLLHGAFREQTLLQGLQYETHASNAYASILDLDYLMHASIDNPITFTINGRKSTFTSPLFETFYVVDNVTQLGQVIPEKSDIYYSIGLHAFHSHYIDSFFGGAIYNKICWCSAMGAMQIVYKGDELARIYGYKAAIELISKILKTDSSIDNQHFIWLDSANLQGDGDNELLTNQIYSSDAISVIDEPSIYLHDPINQLRVKLEAYLHTYADFPSIKDISQLQTDKCASLKSKIMDILSDGDSCIGNAEYFLNELEGILIHCHYKLSQNIDKLKTRYDIEQLALDHSINDYEEYSKRLLTTRSRRSEYLLRVSNRAKTLLKTSIEIKRCNVAMDILSKLIIDASEYSHTINNIRNQLVALCDNYKATLAYAQVTKSHPFECDLSADERANIPLETQDVVVSDFITQSGFGSLIDIKTKEELKAAIDSYVLSLPVAEEYRNKLIGDIIQKINYTDKHTHLKYTISAMTSRTLQIDNRGIYHDIQPYDQYQILCSEEDYNNYYVERLFNDNTIINWYYLKSKCMRQRIIICRTDRYIAPFSISSFREELTSDYEYIERLHGYNPHFDAVLFKQMVNSNFSLLPNIPQDEAEKEE